MSDTSENRLVLNGLDIDSGEYLLPPLQIADVAAIAKGKRLDEERLNALKGRRERDTAAVLGPVADVDPKDLGQTGWGIIFRGDVDPAPIKDALKELLDLRREQANKVQSYYKEYVKDEGVFADQTALDWLVERGTGPGPADPETVPYYLLIIGSPEQIPYHFQYDLDVQYAVGRLHFDTLDEYAQYAHSVVAAERGQVVLPRQVRIVGVANPDDQSTRLSRQDLVEPLASALATKMKPAGWDIQPKLDDEAKKEHLARLLGGDATPSLLFTASHGAGFVQFETPEQQERQRRYQGALVCQDWLGPEEWRGPLKEEFYFSADDVSENAQLQGLIAIFFACYGAGTPMLDDFAHKKGLTSEPQPIAPESFIARLPQRLLGHPKGGALAVVGHVERATGYSFSWPEVGSQTAVFQSALTQLMRGHPIGSALEFFNQRYAELSTTLSQLQISIMRGRIPDNNKLARIWTANNDARSYIILGDPAVRLPVGDVTQATRPTFEEPARVSSSPAPPPAS
jgi:hypothetical protein